jgi:hypothetical protein
MSAFQFESEGKLVRHDAKWLIELATVPEGLEEGMSLGLVFWDKRPDGERSEFEEIARVQQLEIPVVSHGLSASGSLRNEAEAFTERLKREWI